MKFRKGGKVLYPDNLGENMAKNLLLGVGNDIRGDDAVGELVAREFKNEDWDTEDCGSVPENFIPQIENDVYDVVVIVDAAEMKLEPGEMREVPKDRLNVFTMSTHALPLSLVMEFLEEKVKEVHLIGIQPKDMGLKEGMTDELIKAKNKMLDLLKSGGWRDIPSL